MAGLSREDIARIEVGAVVERTIDVGWDMRPRDNAVWSRPARVVEVFGRGTDIRGRDYVCFYTEFGDSARISCSAAEGEGHVRFTGAACP